MRLIDADTLKDELQKWVGREGLSSDGILELAISRVITAPTIGGWIPVTERLPEEEECYLVTTTGEYNNVIDIARYVQGIWHEASRIKAWMPLPKPYKEESQKSIEVFDKRMDEMQKQITALKEQVDMAKVRMHNIEREFVKMIQKEEM